MKYQTLSLFIVASMALAQLRAADSAPMSNPTADDSLDRRTLIGDEMNYSSHVDNSKGKKVYRIDHNGDDSSVRKGLIYDFVERRSLLGDLLGGGDRMSIENVNDNSQHRKTMNSHGNKHTTIKKIHKKTLGGRHRRHHRRDLEDNDDLEAEPATLERRSSLLGDLLGSDSTRIENVNDNSLNRETTKSHGNSHTRITRIHSENEDNDEKDPYEFFDRRDLQEETQESTALNRRGLLWGGDSTSISNVNDNSKTTKTYKSHHNKDTRISKAKYTKRSEAEEESGEDLERRGLLFGGDSMVISNQNDNSKTTKTYNSHDNKYKKITTIKDKSHRRHRRDDDEEDEDEDEDDEGSWFKKRDGGKEGGLKDQATPEELYDQDGTAATTAEAKEKRATTTTTTVLQFDDEEMSENKVDDLERRNLVSVQVVTQNISGQNIDNNVSSVTKGSSKVKAPSGPHRRPEPKNTSTPRRKKHNQKLGKDIKKNGSNKNSRKNGSKKNSKRISKKTSKKTSKKNSKTQ
ncbi:hypothetical protein KVV02_004584 [Mortierella alpina]|uniref:Uncharacterized protein n=1 Tax=Mortierella alpina TaxID=64518 RepID=A0A9P8D1L5_MORAP|nr:hypothetical protein KVV02_004584 [Mortierella alpina]